MTSTLLSKKLIFELRFWKILHHVSVSSSTSLDTFINLINFPKRTDDSQIERNFTIRKNRKRDSFQEISQNCAALPLSNDVYANVKYYIESDQMDDAFKILLSNMEKDLIPMEINSHLARYYSERGCEEKFNLICNHAERNDSKHFKEFGRFLIHKSRLFWVNGNVCKSLKCLEELSDEYVSFDGNICRFLAGVTRIIVDSHSEAHLVQLTAFIKRFCVSRNDYRPMLTLWKWLFLSEWFINQQSAEELLSDHEPLRSYLSLINLRVTSTLVSEHKIEDVYRLMQCLLRFEMKEEYKTALQLLFDYYCE